MKNIVKSNPVAAFVAITFLFSWTLWLLMILSNNNLLPFKFPTNFWGSFGPAVGSIIVTFTIYGSAGLKKLFLSLINVKSSLWNYVFALFLITGIYALVIFIVYHVDSHSVALGQLPGINDLIQYFLLILVVGGPLGEEIGWRGFLQQELHKKHSPLTASVIISAIWFIWHVPLFWLEGAAQEGGSIISFFVSVFSMTFLFTWLFIKTGGSLFFAILFHTTINYVSALIIPFLFPSSGDSKTFGLVFTLVLAGTTVIFVITAMKSFLLKRDESKIVNAT